MANFPQRRAPPPSWMRPLTERLTPTVRGIVVALTLVYFFFVLVPALNPWIATNLLLGPGFWSGKLWQPVSALIINTHFASWLFGLIGFWWVGAFIERLRGQKFFLGLLVGGGIAANAVAATVARLLGDFAPRADGAGFALTALFVAFARIYGPRPAQIWGTLSMRADTFTWILLGFSLVVAIANGDWAGVAATVTAIGAGFLASGGVDSVKSRWRAAARARKASRYQVFEGGKGRRRDLN